MVPNLDSLLAILDLERIEINLFRGVSPQNGWKRVFGGQVIGQALIAAMRTVEDRMPHSLHAYFLLGGDPKVPIVYDVDRIRDGSSFATRRVVAIQHGQAIFSMGVSFHKPEPGYSHQITMPDVPAPETLPAESTLNAIIPESMQGLWSRERPIEMRPVDLRALSSEKREPVQHIWFRAAGKLPDDAALHQCVLAYVSDFSLLSVGMVPHGGTLFDPGLMVASLDHAIWFHRDFRMDDWLLYSQDSPSAEGARAFCRGSIFSREGVLVASVAQEGLIRRKTSRE